MREWLRKIFKCRLGLCGGDINHDGQSVYWRCRRCGKVTR